MSGYSGGESLLGKVLKWTVIGLVAIVASKVILLLLSAVVGAGMFVLFTLGPIALVGWLILKLLRHLTRENQATPY